MKSFREHLKESSKTVYFTFGRMNPPTVGHERLMDKLAEKAGHNGYKVFLTQTNDNKNPLVYESKIKHARKMFPRHARSIVLDHNIKQIFDVAKKLYEQNYTNIVMVVGSDRVGEFKGLLEKYNGVKARHGFYNFKSIEVVSAGERDADSENIEGASSTKLRESAKTNNFPQFVQGLPKEMSNRDARMLFNEVRVGMGLKEQKTFKNHIEMEPVSEEREEYVKGNLFNVGDEIIDDNLREGIIKMLGSNYVTVQYEDGSTSRKWLSDVKTKEVNEVVASMLAAKTKINTDKERLRKQHAREKEASQERHDRIIDRARMYITKKKNRKERKYV